MTVSSSEPDERAQDREDIFEPSPVKGKLSMLRGAACFISPEPHPAGLPATLTRS